MQEAVRAIIIRDNQILLMQRNKRGELYYSLLGGGIEPGEQPDQAIVREVLEETSMSVKRDTLREVFRYNAGAPYGVQIIYLCEVDGDDPVLGKDTTEAASNLLGENIYVPMWVPLDQLLLLPFRPLPVAQAIDESIKHGFPEGVKTI
jgi:8-oxo-dGTP diphosphatase